MTIPISEHRSILKRARLPIAIALILGAVAGVLLTTVLSTTYTSKATIFISVISTDPTKSVESTIRDVDMETEARIAASRSVAERVAFRLDGVGTEYVLDHVSARAPSDSRVLEVLFEAETAEQAQMGAQAVAEEYLAFRTSIASEQTDMARAQIQESIDAVEAELTELLGDDGAAVELTGSDEVRRQVLVSELEAHQEALAELANVVLDPGEIIDDAPLPTSPSSLSDPVIIVGTILAALVAALGFVYLRQALGNARTLDTDIAPGPSGAPALPVDTSTTLPLGAAAVVPAANGLESTLTHLRQRNGSGGIVTGVVAIDRAESAVQVARRLGEDMAAAGQRTVLIDLGAGGLGDGIIDPGKPGLRELATGMAEPADTVHVVRRRFPLWVMSSGSADVSATTDQLTSVIEEARRHHALVVLIGAVNDQQSLAVIADSAQDVIAASEGGASGNSLPFAFQNAGSNVVDVPVNGQVPTATGGVTDPT